MPEDQKHPFPCRAPVIILSTASDIELIVKDCDANDHIRKPFDVVKLVDKVRHTVDHLPLTF